jgi:Toxin PAAR-like domain
MMNSTVIAKTRPVPQATSSGQAIIAFPDVCNTPTPGAPVPIPYPNLSPTAPTSPLPTGQKVKVTGLQTPLVPPQPTPVQLKAKLATLHAQLAGLPGVNPDLWLKLLDDYVVTTASLYIVLCNS